MVEIRCGHLLDVRNGAWLPLRSIRVEGDRIVSVGPTDSTSTEGDIVDLQHATVLPGLIDCHTHLIDDFGQYSIAGPLLTSGAQLAFRAIPHARATLLAGFTTVRDVGTYRAFVDVALRDAIDAGIVLGPRMVPVGAYVTVTGGAGALTGLAPDVALPLELRFGEANGPDAVRQRVRAIVRGGAGCIKVMATGAVLTPGSRPGAAEMTYDELRAAVEEAGRAGLKVACHAHGTKGALDAVRAGVASIEHGSLLDDETLTEMKARGTFLVADLYDNEAILQATEHPAEFREKELAVADSQVQVFRRALALGVRLAYGTDAAVIPHGHNGRQFATYVSHGMSPRQAIQSATVEAAELLGWPDRVGCLEPGRIADLIAVEGNPLETIATLERPIFVMKGGQTVSATRVSLR
ncbi:MAG TPA: amidohydrolase family protein [Candidatus Xenobia bacterium]